MASARESHFPWDCALIQFGIVKMQLSAQPRPRPCHSGVIKAGMGAPDPGFQELLPAVTQRHFSYSRDRYQPGFDGISKSVSFLRRF